MYVFVCVCVCVKYICSNSFTDAYVQFNSFQVANMLDVLSRSTIRSRLILDLSQVSRSAKESLLKIKRKQAIKNNNKSYSLSKYFF